MHDAVVVAAVFCFVAGVFVFTVETGVRRVPFFGARRFCHDRIVVVVERAVFERGDHSVDGFLVLVHRLAGIVHNGVDLVFGFFKPHGTDFAALGLCQRVGGCFLFRFVVVERRIAQPHRRTNTVAGGIGEEALGEPAVAVRKTCVVGTAAGRAQAPVGVLFRSDGLQALTLRVIRALCLTRGIIRHIPGIEPIRRIQRLAVGEQENLVRRRRAVIGGIGRLARAVIERRQNDLLVLCRQEGRVIEIAVQPCADIGRRVIVRIVRLVRVAPKRLFPVCIGSGGKDKAVVRLAVDDRLAQHKPRRRIEHAPLQRLVQEPIC